MTGQVLPQCPKPECFIWTPHTHGCGPDTILVAPIIEVNER